MLVISVNCSLVSGDGGEQRMGILISMVGGLVGCILQANGANRTKNEK